MYRGNSHGGEGEGSEGPYERKVTLCTESDLCTPLEMMTTSKPLLNLVFDIQLRGLLRLHDWLPVPTRRPAA